MVTSCSPRPMRAGQVVGHHLHRQPGAVGGAVHPVGGWASQSVLGMASMIFGQAGVLAEVAPSESGELSVPVGVQ